MFFPEKIGFDRLSQEHFKMIDRFCCDSDGEHRKEIMPYTGDQSK
jgi:hypothetical protein